MKILFYDWEALSQKGFIKGLQQLNHEVVVYSRKVTNHLMDEEFLSELAVKIVQEKIELVMSFNFIPMVSMACQATKRIYISWIYSCPHYSLRTLAAKYEGNYIFVFDRNYAMQLKESGLSNVFHLPLAVDTEIFQKEIEGKSFQIKGNQFQEKSRTKSKYLPGENLSREQFMDLSFVGSLYTGERDYFDQINDLPEYLKGYVDGICEAQKKIYGMDIISSSITQPFLEIMKKYVPFQMDATMNLSFEEFLISIIQKKTTIEEREDLIKSLADETKVYLFTGSKADHLTNVKLMGTVDYYEEMPKVFRQSKCNLNITLRSITSGIPLRALDICGSGGFLLSNYQIELAEYFEDRKELALWGSKEELIDLTKYYLTHETERLQITERGFEKVKSCFSYQEQLTKMFSMIVGDL